MLEYKEVGSGEERFPDPVDVCLPAWLFTSDKAWEAPLIFGFRPSRNLETDRLSSMLIVLILFSKRIQVGGIAVHYEGHLSKESLLSFIEINRMAHAFLSQGIKPKGEG